MNKHDPFSAIPDMGAIKETVKSKTTVKIGPESQKSGWGIVSVSNKLGYHNKPDPNQWNQNDLQWYLKNRYADKYGVTLNIPIASGHNWIGTIKFAMSKKFDGQDPPNSVIKDYFDYCLDKHADEIIRSEGQFSLYKLTKAKYILDYLDRRGVENNPQPIPAIKPVEASVESINLSIQDLTTAYRINSQYMVMNYGIVIPINYLMLVKGKTVDEAIAYVQAAMTKLAAKGPMEMGAAIEATNKFQPYPKWLKFIDANKIVKMTLAFSDDNPVFDCFKEQQ